MSIGFLPPQIKIFAVSNRRLVKIFGAFPLNLVKTASSSVKRGFHTFNDVFNEDISWSDVNGPMKTLHDYNKVRVPFIIKSYLSRPNLPADSYLSYLKSQHDNALFKGLKIFELGCGGGILSEALAKLGMSVFAIDSSTTAIDHANKRLEKLKKQVDDKLDITYICKDFKEFVKSKNGSKYSIIVCSEVLEHMEYEDKLLFFSESKNLLEDDGIIVVTTPSKTVFSLFFNIFIAENVLNYVPKNTHQFSLFISHEELLKMAGANGFREFNSTGLLYLPFLRKFVPLPSKCQLYMSAFHSPECV